MEVGIQHIFSGPKLCFCVKSFTLFLYCHNLTVTVAFFQGRVQKVVRIPGTNEANVYVRELFFVNVQEAHWRNVEDLFRCNTYHRKRKGAGLCSC